MINNRNSVQFHRQNVIKQQTVFRGMPGRVINHKNVINNKQNINVYQQKNMGHIGNNHINNTHNCNNHIGNNSRSASFHRCTVQRVERITVNNNNNNNSHIIKNNNGHKSGPVISKQICIPHLEKCNDQNQNHDCTLNKSATIKVENKKNIRNIYKAINPFNVSKVNENNNVTIVKISDITKQRKPHNKPQQNKEIPLKSHEKQSLFECPICHKVKTILYIIHIRLVYINIYCIYTLFSILLANQI